MKPNAHKPHQPKRSLRILFQYEASTVNIVKVELVATTAPPADRHPAERAATGFWYELRDADDNTLYRRVTQNPIRIAYEVTTGEPDRPLAWKPAREVRGTFPLLLPDLEQATTLVLFSSPLDPARACEPAQELRRFSLPKNRADKGA